MASIISMSRGEPKPARNEQAFRPGEQRLEHQGHDRGRDRTEQNLPVVEHLQTGSNGYTISPAPITVPSVAVPMLMTAEVRNPVKMD